MFAVLNSAHNRRTDESLIVLGKSAMVPVFTPGAVLALSVEPSLFGSKPAPGSAVPGTVPPPFGAGLAPNLVLYGGIGLDTQADR